MRLLTAPSRLWRLFDRCVDSRRARLAFQDAASAVLDEVQDIYGRDLLSVEVDGGGVIHLAMGFCHDEVKVWLARGLEIRPMMGRARR